MLQNYMSALNPKNHEKKPSSSQKFKKEANSLCSQSAMNFLLFLPKSNCWNLVFLSSVHFLDFADFYSFFLKSIFTVFENHRNNLINIASEVDKSLSKMQKLAILASFWKSLACGQTVLPDRQLLLEQKLVEYVKIQKFECYILSNF